MCSYDSQTKFKLPPGIISMDYSGLYRIDHKKKKNKFAGILKQYFLPIIIIFFIAYILQLIIRILLIFPVKISTDTMEPALKKNESVFLIYPGLSDPKEGDIVLVQHEKTEWFCRIVAMEGDLVQIKDKVLFINRNIFKNYSEISKDRTNFPLLVSSRDNTPEFANGPRKFFCLNDNWENIQDSRTWGPLSIADITGKVIFRKRPPEYLVETK